MNMSGSRALEGKEPEYTPSACFVWNHNEEINPMIPKEAKGRLDILDKVIESEKRKGSKEMASQLAKFSSEKVRIIENDVPMLHALDKATAKYMKRRAATAKKLQQQQPQSGQTPQRPFKVDIDVLETVNLRMSIHQANVQYLLKVGKVTNAKAALEFVVSLRQNMRCWQLVSLDSSPPESTANANAHAWESNNNALIGLVNDLANLESGLGNNGRAALLRQRADGFKRDNVTQFVS